MIKLRPIETADITAILSWPPYPPEFAELDYALRKNGWLDEFLDNLDARLYVAEQDGEIVAFTLLARTSATDAEYRIALRADMIGQGLGKTLTAMTLEKGFVEMQLDCIHLIVRKNNPRAIGLYQSLGFTGCGECLLEVNGKPVNFFTMRMNRKVHMQFP
ncbi:MAG: GNAT family N-acetyltransferase [Nitrosomonadales bacterium]|nr:GNAT family N-acetyltransferase [Nitrosomonadales bacterium]